MFIKELLFQQDDDTRLRLLVAFICATPFFMVFSREVPPLILILTVILVVLEIWRREKTANFARRVADSVFSSGGLLISLFLGWTALSLTWTTTGIRSYEFFFHMLGTAILATLLVAGIRLLRARVYARDLLIVLLLPAVLIIIDMNLGGTLRSFIGLRDQGYLLNRAAIALVLFLPLATVLFIRERGTGLLVALWATVGIAVFSSHSESAKLALIITALVLGATWIAPRLAHALASLSMVALIFATPFLAPLTNRIVPDSFKQLVGRTLTDRGDIWREYMLYYWEKPILGHGLESSFTFKDTPYASDLTGARLEAVTYMHPHNAIVQIWFELGLGGAVLLAATVALLMRAIGRLPPKVQLASTATAVSVFAVSAISHGAWQAWWWGLVALIAAANVCATSSAEKAERVS